jgi:YHS domain-containing protein
MTVCRLLSAFLMGIGCFAVPGYAQGIHYNCPICPTCQANVQFFGHYPTRWRPWPGESRPDIHFPQSIGAEPTKRPAGETLPELPKETLQPVVPRPRQALPEPLPGEMMPESQPGVYPPPSPPMPPVTPGIESSPPQPVPSAALPPQSSVTSPPPAGALPPAAVPQPQGEPSSLPSPMPPTPIPAQPVPPVGPSPSQPPENNPGTTGAIQPRLESPALGLADPPSVPWTFVAPPTSVAPATAPWASVTGKDIRSNQGPTSQPGPLAITNPTVVVNGPALPAQRVLSPQNKLEVSRSDSLPDLTAAPWLPSVGGLNSTAASERISGKAPVIAQTNANSPAIARSSQLPTPAVTVWTEDSPDTHVTAASFAASPERSPSGVTNSPVGVVAAAGTVVSPTLNGYCPVELVENESWIKGESRFAVEYGGKTYFCAGATQKRKFQTNPERYVPVCNGRDPVLLVDQGVLSEGRIDHCVVYDGRLYMFSSAASLARFRQNPQHYARIASQVLP